MKKTSVQTAIGYSRASNGKQTHEAQISAINAAAARAGLKLEAIISETISSRKTDREIYAVIKQLRPGQTLIVYELSRLGRSLTEILNIVDAVKAAGAILQVLSPALKLGAGLSSAEEIQGETLIFALGLGARIERDLISERTKNALAERKRQGVKLGRPKGIGVKAERLAKSKGIDIDHYLSVGLTAPKIAKLIGTDARTVKAYSKQLKSETPKTRNPLKS